MPLNIQELLQNWTEHLPFITTLLIITWLAIKYVNTPKNLPSGPWGVPILGYIPFLGDKPHVTIAKMRGKYGDVIRLNMGKRDMIFLNSYKSVKEALLKQADVFAIRPVYLSPRNSSAHAGIIQNNGEMWADFRRFTLSTLRDFGFGKSTLEPQIKEEIEYFLKEIEKHNGKPADIRRALHASVTNVICLVMTGHRSEYDGKMFNDLLDISSDHINRLGITKLENCIPDCLRMQFVLNLFGIQSPVHTAALLIQNLTKVVDTYEKEHEEGGRNNFIDAWFTESEKTGKKINNFTKDKLPGVVLDLFLAGSDTTTNTLGWSLLYVAKYPEIQKKVQQEIDEIIGKERTPSMSDQKLMPYTEATLMEVSRIVTILPLSLYHSATKDTIVSGCLIPKGSVVSPNLWAVHHDPEIFPDCEEFKPERFLTDEQQLKKIEELIPFSIGKRQCMGESLARMELFLFFTSMLQRFTFSKADGEELDFDYHNSTITKPNPQNLCATLR